MSRILFVWELGEGLGHVGSFPLIARRLREKGHRVAFALRDLSQGYRLFGRDGFPLFQAPLWMGRKPHLPLAASFAEVLPRVGYQDPDALTGLMLAWKELLGLWRPDAVLFNHSPTALLASRGMGFPRAMQGTGFSCPAVSTGQPVFTPWAPVPAERLLGWEQRLLEIINESLRRVGGVPLGSLSDLVDADETFLCTLPEMDPYRRIRGADARYWGPVPSEAGGTVVDWPGTRRPRVFAYLKASYGNLNELLEALRGLDGSVIAYLSGMAPEQAGALSSDRLRVTTRPVDLVRQIRECDGLVCHGGHGTSADALMAGVPLLVVPLHVENWINGQSIAQSGAGLVTDWGRGVPDFAALLQRLCAEGPVRERARELGAAYAGWDREARIGAIAERLEALL